mgnify:CR=1 FL=1
MRLKFIKQLILLLLPCLLICLVGCRDDVKEPEYVIKKYSYYGYLNTNSSVTIQFDKNVISEEEMKIKMNNIDKILVDIEKDFSMQKTIFMDGPSLLMQVNANSGKLDENNNLVFTKVNQKFMNMLKTAIEVSELLDGSFDVTVGPLTRLWNISGQVGYDPMFVKIPTAEQVEEAKALVNYKNILIDEENMQVCLPIAGMEIDFGAIAKGYAADCVLEYMKTLPIEVALIDLGGNIYTYGSSPTTSQSVGIRNPFYNNDTTQVYQLMSADIRDISIVTSGTYERYVVKDGVTYHHLLNPKTGYPFDNEMYCVTIIGKSSMFCDAIATGIYGLGLEEGINMINQIDGYSAIFITTDKKVYLTKGLNFVPTEGTDDFTFIYS